MWTKEQVGTGNHSSPCPLAADQSFKSPKVKGQKPAGNVWESLSGRSPEGSWRDLEKEAQEPVRGRGRAREAQGRAKGQASDWAELMVACTSL